MRVKALILLFALALAFASCQTAAATDEGTYSVREYSLPANAAEIGAMTVDAAGNVWLIQNEPPVLYKLVRENGTFSNYTLDGFTHAGFAGMSVDEVGLVWFADPKGNRFGAYKEADNKTSTFDFPGPMAPSSVLRRGDILYIGCKEEVGVYDLRFPEEPLMDYFVQYGSFVKDIHFDRFYNVWFVEYDTSKVGVYWRTYDKISDFRHTHGQLVPDLPVHRQPRAAVVRGKRHEQARDVSHGAVQLFGVCDAGRGRQNATRLRCGNRWRQRLADRHEERPGAQVLSRRGPVRRCTAC